MSGNLTGAGTHRATAPGYAGGSIVPIGGEVPPGIPVGSWMEEVQGATVEAPPPAPSVLAAFDHDGDGRPGGSLPGPRRRKKK